MSLAWDFKRIDDEGTAFNRSLEICFAVLLIQPRGIMEVFPGKVTS